MPNLILNIFVKIHTVTDISQLADHNIHVFDPLLFKDSRGQITVRAEDTISKDFPYSNYFSYKLSTSEAGVARGLHWQRTTTPIIKYIDLRKGSLYTVLVDTRTEEGIIFKWTSDIGKIIKVSEHHAHGFYCTQDTEFSYICKGKYDPQEETTFNVFPSICRQIKLPEPLLSHKDAGYPEIEVQLR
tara:strand:- start:713 stop:1270 length:558 start_codon:yes stop_codon:yes gene_type:complete